MIKEPQALRLRRRPKRLATELVNALTQQIRGCVLRPGDKLPTESKIMAEFGVSRTVVREAISGLQSAGLVETKHGVGTFVLDSSALVFRVSPSSIPTVRDIQSMLELRIGLETEAAALAAERCSKGELEGLRQGLAELLTALPTEGGGAEADFQFHLKIARATGNPYFAEVMGHFGTTTIPRTRVSVFQSPEDREHFYKVLSREHEQIFSAIERRDPKAASKLMRTHLANSIERFAKAQPLNSTE